MSQFTVSQIQQQNQVFQQALASGKITQAQYNQAMQTQNANMAQIYNPTQPLNNPAPTPTPQPTPQNFNPVPPEPGTPQAQHQGNWVQTGTITSQQTVPVYTRNVNNPLAAPTQAGTQTIYSVIPIRDTTLSDAKQQIEQNTFAQLHPRGGTMNPFTNQLVVTGDSKKDPYFGVVNIPNTVNPTQQEIYNNLTPENQQVLHQYQSQKTTDVMVNLGLFLGASAIGPALAPVAIGGIAVPGAVVAAGAGVGISQAVKTGITVYQGGNIGKSLLTPQEAFVAGETGIIFSGATQGVLAGVSQAGSTGQKIVGNAFGRFGLNTGTGVGVGAGLEAAQTGQVTKEGFIQNLAFSAGFAGIGEGIGAIGKYAPTWLGGGVKGQQLVINREVQFSTPADAPLPNGSNIKIEGIEENPFTNNQMVTSRFTEVEVKNVRVPYKDAVIAKGLLENSRNLTVDFAGSEVKTTFRPPTEETKMFNTKTLENNYPMAGEVTTYGRVQDLGANVKLVPDTQTILPRNNLLDMTGKVSSDKISGMENSFLPQTEFTNTNGVTSRETSFFEESIDNPLNQKLTRQQIESGRQNLTPKMDMPFTKNVTTEVSSRLMTGDIKAIRKSVMGFNEGEQFSSTRVADPYLAIAKGEDLTAGKFVNYRTPTEQRVSIRTGEANLDNAVTDFRFKTGMEVSGMEVSEFDIKVPFSKKPNKPAVFLEKRSNFSEAVSNQSSLQVRDITAMRLRGEVNPSDMVAYAQNLPENMRQDIYTRFGVGEMEGAPKNISEQFAKGIELPYKNLDMTKAESLKSSTKPFDSTSQENWVGSKITEDFNKAQTKSKQPFSSEEYNNWTKVSGSIKKPLEGFPVKDTKTGEVLTYEGYSKGSRTEKLVTELSKSRTNTKATNVSKQTIDIPHNLISVNLESKTTPLISGAMPQQKKQRTSTTEQGRNYYPQYQSQTEESDYLYASTPKSGLASPNQILQPINQRSQTLSNGQYFYSSKTVNDAAQSKATIQDQRNSLFPIQIPYQEAKLNQNIQPITNQPQTTQQRDQQGTIPFLDNPKSAALGLSFPGGKALEGGFSLFGTPKKGGLQSTKKLYPILTAREFLGI